MNNPIDKFSKEDHLQKIDSLGFENVAKEILTQGRTIIFHAQVGSMRPFIIEGDLLEMQSVQEGCLHVGDVVMIPDPNGGLVVHRIKRITENADVQIIQTQGDANLIPDAQIPSNEVIARLKLIKRNGKIIDPDSVTQRIKSRLWIIIAPVLKRIYFLLKGQKPFCNSDN